MITVPRNENAPSLSYNERVIKELLERKKHGKTLQESDFGFEKIKALLRAVSGNLSDTLREERDT